MRYSTILALAGTALALPAADPRPNPTAAADPKAAPIAAPAPTAMADPQLGFGVTTPFNNGPRPQGQQQPGYYEGRPPTATCNGLAAFCIYSSVSGSIYSSVSGSIQEGIMDAIGLNGNHRSTTIVYVPTPGPGQYSNGGYRPNQGGNYGGYQPNQGGNNGWPAQPQPGPGQYQNNGWKE